MEICTIVHVEQETTIKYNLLWLKDQVMLKKQPGFWTEVGPLCCY